MAKIIATVEIDIPEPDPADSKEQFWSAGFRDLYDLWHPLDLDKIKEAIADSLTDEHHGICEYQGARVIAVKQETE